MSILVVKNVDEPLEFESVATLLQWIGSKTDNLSEIRSFFDGGFIVDSAGSRYSLADL